MSGRVPVLRKDLAASRPQLCLVVFEAGHDAPLIRDLRSAQPEHIGSARRLFVRRPAMLRNLLCSRAGNGKTERYGKSCRAKPSDHTIPPFDLPAHLPDGQ